MTTRAILLALALCAGCTVADRDYTGPTITVVITDANGVQVEDTDTGASFSLENGDAMYELTATIQTTDGQEVTGSTTNYSPVAQVTAVFTAAGATTTLHTSDFATDDPSDDPAFTANMPVAIPMSAMGSDVAITATAVDGNGLESNVDSFSIGLN